MANRKSFPASKEDPVSLNDKLRGRIGELEIGGNDLNNLLESCQIIMVCFDRELRLRWFSPPAHALFRLQPGDIGRAMATLPEPMAAPSALAAAQAALDGRESALADVPWQRHWYARRILPYRTAEGSTNGVVMVLSDITEIKAASESLLAERAQQAARLEQGMADRTAQLRELSMALTLAEEQERRAVAVDLHDDLGQTLALLKIRLDLLRQKTPESQISDELQAASNMLQQASDRVRSLAFQLSPSVLYELGLVPALEWFADEMKRLYDLDVVIDADAGSRRELDPNVRTLLFRAIRELLINVAKHANVGVAHVECRRLAGELEITVADAGKGFDPQAALSKSGQRGFGLLSVRERLAGLGGTLNCESVIGDGSRVMLRVPVVAEKGAREPPK